MFLVLVVTDELRQFLVRARSGTGRLIQVLIRDGKGATVTEGERICHLLFYLSLCSLKTIYQSE